MSLTVLSAQQAVEDFLHYDRVEFDQFGESLDDFILDQRNNQKPLVTLLKTCNK